MEDPPPGEDQDSLGHHVALRGGGRGAVPVGPAGGRLYRATTNPKEGAGEITDHAPPLLLGREVEKLLATGAVTVREALRADRAREPSILKCREDDISQCHDIWSTGHITTGLLCQLAGKFRCEKKLFGIRDFGAQSAVRVGWCDLR